MKHPLAVGVGVGLVLGAAWWKRHWIAAMFRRVAHPLHGITGDINALLPPSNIGGPPGVAIRQLRRYTFASMQDMSPTVGLTHASYALNALEFLEESLGRDAIVSAGYDPVKVRAVITGLQDKHGKALESCDPYITQVLALERGGLALPGAAPAGA
jgi:hypothetical protein